MENTAGMKSALVMGAGGFIGSHLVKFLKKQGYWVRGADIKHTEYDETAADDFVIADLSTEVGMNQAFDRDFDRVYQLAADMGGAGYIFTGENDAMVMQNSSLINLQCLRAAREFKVGTLFYSSSACVYPERNQLNPDDPNTAEHTVYPAAPDSEYGWEKLYAERLYLAHARNFEQNTRIARFHNIFGPLGSWNNGKEKVPAAMCRKVAEVEDGGSIEVWGDGLQTRSFLHIDECLEAVERLMVSDVTDPINIGSAEMISINNLAKLVSEVAGKNINIINKPGPEGVRGRSSDNNFIYEKLGWKPSEELREGIVPTYAWIKSMVEQA
jgi:nucleoside-diphosphate-sugar epimerase